MPSLRSWSSQSQIVLYSSVASQWANVPHLALHEKGVGRDEYELEEIDLGM